MTAVTTSAPRRDSARTTRTDLTLLGVLTLGLRIPAFVAERHLTFDDGVFGASAVAMRAGGQPFRDVFSSQGPLFLPLLWLADVMGLRTINAPRVLSLLAALLLVGATYAAGRAITDRDGAVIAAVLVSVTGTSLWVTGPIAADGAALAFATLTVALALRWRHEITVKRAVWLGLGVGATISVKALLAPAILPVALVLLAGRRIRPILAGAATADRLPLGAVAALGGGQRVGAVVRVPPRRGGRSHARRQRRARCSAPSATAISWCSSLWS